MLRDVRDVTLKGVSKLSKDQLFTPPAVNEYPIGAYLMHLCECDIHWLEVLSGESINESCKQQCYFDKWFDPSGTPSPPSAPPDISEYAKSLHETRGMLLGYLTQLKDTDLESSATMKSRKGDIEISKKWIVYHLIEHEAHHRGQMFMLMRMAGWNSQEQLDDRKSQWWLGDDRPK